jgi:hypothetical protein
MAGIGAKMLRYWIHRYSLSVPAGVFELASVFVLARALGVRPYRGIKIVPAPPCHVQDLSAVHEALDLLRRADPRRFNRIERSVKWIVVGNWKPRGYYDVVSHVCGIRKLSPLEAPPSVAPYAYATVLVHEGTHAMLLTKRFPHGKADGKRIEKLCVLEEARFLMKFPAIRSKLPLILGYARKVSKDRR